MCEEAGPLQLTIVVPRKDDPKEQIYGPLEQDAHSRLCSHESLGLLISGRQAKAFGYSRERRCRSPCE
jgi:hypothetical protein